MKRLGVALLDLSSAWSSVKVERISLKRSTNLSESAEVHSSTWASPCSRKC